MNVSSLKFLIISSLVLSNLFFYKLSMATEDIVFLDRSLHIRSLAASCVACHGGVGERADGIEVAGLSGMAATAIVTALQDFKEGKRIATVMHHHAKGLNSQEVMGLAEYFSAQTPRKKAVLPTQELRIDHGN
jgi:cytochrome c553